MIMSSLLGQNSEVTGVSSVLQSGHLFVPTSTTHIRGEYGTRFTSRLAGEHSSYVDATPTHLYFIYSYCSSRPGTGAIFDP